MRERAISSMTEPVRRKPSQRAKVRMASSRVVQDVALFRDGGEELGFEEILFVVRHAGPTGAELAAFVENHLAFHGGADGIAQDFGETATHALVTEGGGGVFDGGVAVAGTVCR